MKHGGKDSARTVRLAVGPIVETLERRSLLSSVPVWSHRWGDDSYEDPSLADFQFAAIAQGRIGNNAWTGDYEISLDDNNSNNGVIATAQKVWTSGTAQEFELTYSPSSQQLTFVIAGQTQTYSSFSYSQTEYDALFIRTRATRAGSTMAIGELQIQTAATGGYVDVPLPYNEPGPASVATVQSADPNTRESIQLYGTDLNAGFSLKGEAIFTWGSTVPSGSNLAFQIKLGSWQSKVDVDVDSNNDQSITPAEDPIELESPGKIAYSNDWDRDGDRIPDFADGMDQFPDMIGSDTPPTEAQATPFIPVVVTLPASVDVSTAELYLQYSDAGSSVTRTGSGTSQDPYVFETALDGAWRLWTKPSHEQRNPDSIQQGGDYIGELGIDYYQPADLAAMGFTSSNRTVTLYAEAVRPTIDSFPDENIFKFTFDPDGSGTALELGVFDDVAVTAIRSELPPEAPDQVGANYNQRVDIHGVPLPDPSPTGEGESDRIPNMAFIDAYGLTPSFSTTDVAVPMPGGELLLEFRRTMAVDSQSINLDPNAGMFANARFSGEDILGDGWSTNLNARVMLSFTAAPIENQPAFKATVFDETGNAMSYRAGSIALNDVLTPDVRSTFSNEALKGTLKVTGVTANLQGKTIPASFTLTKKHGTKLFYSLQGTPIDRSKGNNGETVDYYYRLDRIVDRNYAEDGSGNQTRGNRLDYHYGLSDPLLVTEVFDPTTGDEDTATRRISIGYEGGKVETVTDPLGRTYTYSYHTTETSEDAAGRLHRVVKPLVIDPATGVLADSAPAVEFDYYVSSFPQLSYQSVTPSAITEIDGLDFKKSVTWTMPK